MCNNDVLMLVGSMKCLVVAVEVDCGGVLCLSHPGDVGRPLSWGSWQRRELSGFVSLRRCVRPHIVFSFSLFVMVAVMWSKGGAGLS